MVEPRTKEKVLREADENGRLAILVKQGDTQAASALWERVERLIYKLVSKYFPLCQRCGIEPDDLKQAGYFAMLRAVNSYDPERGFRFNSYLENHVSNVARETLGIRGHKSRPRGVKSLDETLPGVEGDNVTVGDALPDEAATEALESVEQSVYVSQLHNALEVCLGALPDTQENIIRSRYFDGMTLKDVADREGLSVPRIHQLEGQALRCLRKPQNARRLESFREDIINRSYRGVGFRAYSEQQSSAVERAAERLEQGDSFDVG